MKRFFIQIVFIALLCSCGVDRGEYERAEAERDSLAQIALKTQTELESLQAYVAEVSGCVDSISQSEGLLMVNRDPESGRQFTRAELRERVKNFANLVDRQRRRIAMLTDSLRYSGSNAPEIENLMTMVDYLNEQLEAKEQQLDKLRTDLEKSNLSLAKLGEDMTLLRNANAHLAELNAHLDRTVSGHADRMNEAYFLAADKQTLEELGLLKGGFMKKSKFLAENIDLNVCQKVDKRTFTTELLQSKKPKLLTQAPAGSYTFRKTADGNMELVVLDRHSFWSLSNIAIVRL